MKNIILFSIAFNVFANLCLAADVEIVQKDRKFLKTEKGKDDQITKIKLKVGDSITFKNEEKEITHNVYSLGPKNSFEIQVQEPGKKSTINFKEKGTTDVECAIHPSMKLKVEVE